MANAEPSLTGLDTEVTFAENAVNAAPALIDAGLSFTDADFDGGRLVVSGLLAEDRVAIRDQGFGAGQIGLFGNNVTYGGTAIGVFEGGVGGTFTITLFDSATALAVDALLQNLTYANASNAPTESRTLYVDVVDRRGASLKGDAAFAEATGAANPFDGVNVGLYSAPGFVDLDGDGDLDAVVGSLDGSLRSLRNDSGRFTGLTGAADPFAGIDLGSYSAPSFADLDGDGDLDLVVGLSDGTLRSLRNDGGRFTELTGAANPFNGVDLGFRSKPGFADLDGDGDLDAVVGERLGGLRAFRNDGARFTELTGGANPFNGVDAGLHAAPGFADLDGDGDLDAVVGNSDGALRVFRNDGGRFTEQTGAANPLSGVTLASYAAPGFADLDGDGDLDALVGNSSGTLRLFTNTAALGVPVVVTVSAEADAPSLSELSPSVLFAENAVNGSPAILDGDVAFTLGSANLSAGRIVISGLLAEDRLGVASDGTVSVVQGAIIVNGVGIGQATGGTGGDLEIALNANATATAVEAVLERLTYANASDAPTPSRTLRIDVIDAAGAGVNGSEGGLALIVGVAAEDDRSTVRNDAATVVDGVTATILVGANDSDPDGVLPAITTIDGVAIVPGGSVALASGARVTLANDGALTYDPAGAFDYLLPAGQAVRTGAASQASDAFTYTRADGEGAAVAVTVMGAAGPGDELRFAGRYEGADALVIDAAALGGAGAVRLSSARDAGASGRYGYHLRIVDDALDAGERLLIDANRLRIGEVLRFDGSAERDGWFQIAGGRGDDVLTGGGGNDVIDGKSGADTMSGGEGNDRYYVDTKADLVIEAAGGGVDQVFARVDYRLAEGMEVEQLRARSDAGLGLGGNSFGNVVIGGAGSDRLDGAGGADELRGWAGDDVLDGGAGADKLLGGAGADRFVFASAAEANRDRVGDFSRAEGDRLDLSAIDADIGLPGDQSFSFIGDGAFTREAGQLRAVLINGRCQVQGDLNGDGKADFGIVVLADAPLAGTDFLL